MAKTAAERKRDERERKRSAGLVEHRVWVKPEKWPEIQRFVAKVSGGSEKKTKRIKS